MKNMEKVIRATQFQKPLSSPSSHDILPPAQFRYHKSLSKVTYSYNKNFGVHQLQNLVNDKLLPLFNLRTYADDWVTLYYVTEEGRKIICCKISKDVPLVKMKTIYK